MSPGSCSSARVFFLLLGFFLLLTGFFLIIGGFLDYSIFSKFFFWYFVLEAKQSPQMASGAPRVAARCPFLVPPRVVHPASVKKVISSQILSLHRYKCWPTRLCHPNGPGLGGVLITLAAMYLQGLRTQPALVQPFNTNGTTNPFISWLWMIHEWLIVERVKQKCIGLAKLMECDPLTRRKKKLGLFLNLLSARWHLWRTIFFESEIWSTDQIWIPKTPLTWYLHKENVRCLVLSWISRVSSNNA